MGGRRRFLAQSMAASIAGLVAPHSVAAQAGPLDTDFIIIGAGAAGIAAARLLLGLGRRVVLLEARDRVGGRAWTSTEALGLPWDRGAQWLHNGRDNPLWSLARRAGRDPIWSDFENMQVTGPDGAAQALFAGFDALDDRIDRAATQATAQTRLDTLITGAPWADAALHLSALSIGGDPAQIALHDAAMMESGADALVPGGPGGLLGALAQDLPIQLGHMVRAIDMRAGDQLVVSGDFGQLSARAVLVTIPPMVLAQGALAVTPPLPARHREAFAALLPADFIKVGLRLPAMAQGGAEFAVDPSALLAGMGALLHLDPRAPLASVLFAGRHARDLAAAGPAGLAEAAQAVLYHHTGQRAIATDSHDWRADPFSGGTWALLQPGAASARQDYVAPVEDRLFFAGEAAPGPFATTLGGAWLSGLAAAEAMDAAV